MKKVEIGGGRYPRPKEDGFINVDQVDNADIIYDLNKRPWSFVPSNSVDELYSSHCFEHLNDMNDVLFQICLICKEGAKVEFRVPHPRADLAMVWDHKHVYSPLAARNMNDYFPQDMWKGRGPRRLRFDRYEYRAAETLREFRKEQPQLAALYGTDEQIMKWVPGTCHEVAYHCTVIKNEYN